MNNKESKIRLKSYSIVLFGLILVVTALFSIETNFSATDKLFTFLFNIGISVITIGVITFIWDILGGDPISKALRWFKKRITLEELGFRNLSIRNTMKGTSLFIERDKMIRSAMRVDLMGLVLWREWFQDKDFIDACESALRSKKPRKFRIIILKPLDPYSNSEKFIFESSKILYQRAIDEVLGCSDEKVKNEAIRMNIGICNTLEVLKNIRKNLLSSKIDMLTVRVANETSLNCSILRINNQIFVVHYLHKRGGANTPIIEIRGPDTELFNIYEEEFKIVWDNSPEWDFDNNCIKTTSP